MTERIATAKILRKAAEVAALTPPTWSNFEATCLDALRSIEARAYNEGYKTGREQGYSEHVSQLRGQDMGN